jgi:hypothetical protein
VDLSGDAGGDLLPVVVEEPELDTGQRMAVGVQPLVAGLLVPRPGDRRMLGRAVHAHDRDVHGIGAVSHRCRDRGTAQPDMAHQRPVLVREVGMIEQAREEERCARAAVDAVFEHGGEDGRRVPHVDEVDRLASEDGDEQRGEHADAVTDWRAGEGGDATAGLHRAELADLETNGAVRVHDALWIRGRAGGVRDEGGRRWIDARGRVHGVAVGERREREHAGRDVVVRYYRDELKVGHFGVDRVDVGEVVEVAEAVGGDEDARAGLIQDEPDFLQPVEVHDRDGYRAQERRRPERGRRLDPVRQLERHQVTRPDTSGAQTPGDAAGEVGDVAECARVRTQPGSDFAGEVAPLGQTGGQDLPERVVVPRAVGDVAARELGRRRAELPGGHSPSFCRRRKLRLLRRRSAKPPSPRSTDRTWAGTFPARPGGIAFRLCRTLFPPPLPGRTPVARSPSGWRRGRSRSARRRTPTRSAVSWPLATR